MYGQHQLSICISSERHPMLQINTRHSMWVRFWTHNVGGSPKRKQMKRTNARAFFFLCWHATATLHKLDIRTPSCAKRIRRGFGEPNQNDGVRLRFTATHSVECVSRSAEVSLFFYGTRKRFSCLRCSHQHAFCSRGGWCGNYVRL